MKTSIPPIGSKAWKNAILAAIKSGNTEFKVHPVPLPNPAKHKTLYSIDTLKKAHEFLLTLDLPKTEKPT